MTREGLATEEATYKNIRIDHLTVWTLLAAIFITSIDNSAILSLVLRNELQVECLSNLCSLQDFTADVYGPV